MTPERRPRLGLAIAGAGAIGLMLWLAIRGRDPVGGPLEPQVVWEPLPRRVEVQVLNGGTIAGAARAATAVIRRGGLDVVLFGDARDSLRDSARRVPLVLVRRGDTTGVGRLRELFDTVEVRDAPDPRPLVDLTVVIGDTGSREP